MVLLVLPIERSCIDYISPLAAWLALPGRDLQPVERWRALP
jgi:hypothetical protein